MLKCNYQVLFVHIFDGLFRMIIRHKLPDIHSDTRVQLIMKMLIRARILLCLRSSNDLITCYIRFWYMIND